MAIILKVIKRDGNIVDFDKKKIYNAITKAMLETSDGVDEKLASNIASKIELNYQETKSVEEIQDLVEEYLMLSSRPDAARKYIRYRYQREVERERIKRNVEQIKPIMKCESIENSNANLDEYSFSGKNSRANALILKEYALEELIDKDVAAAHKKGLLYLHDLSEYATGSHNCINVNVEKLLREGFTTRNGDVRAANSLSTACQLIAVILQAQSQVQFGGAGCNKIDYDLVPYVKISFSKHLKKNIKRLYGIELELPKMISIVDEYYAREYPKAFSAALEDLEEEGRQSMQALFHNLNTLESRPGSQVPFTSLNYGCCTEPEGQKVSEWLLRASMSGIGKYHRTPIFPISIFVYKKGVNDKPGTPNYYLKKMAIESMSHRIYPNFVNGDWSQNQNDGTPDTLMTTMGCRTFTMNDVNGLGYRKTGRGNCVPTTMNLPMLAIPYGICLGEREKPDLDGFWAALDSLLDLTKKSLLDRFDYVCSQSVRSAPFMYQNETCVDADKAREKGIYETMKHFSLNFGYIGIAEMCIALFGKHHGEDSEVYKFANCVINHIYQYAEKAKEEYHLNFAVYSTPAENSCKTLCDKIVKEYGEIDRITDKGFLTNSCHIPVDYELTIKRKIDLEAPLDWYSTAGAILYVELESSVMSNQKALESIIDYAMEKDTPYFAINFPIDTCLDCGFSGEIEDDCPVCKSRNIERLRRVTGYLTTDYTHFNEGKIKEVEMRYKHSKKGSDF